MRLAETPPGLVIEHTDDYVDITFGAVCLHWLKQYLVLHQRLGQHREDAGALHHLSGIRRSAFVRVGVFPGTGNRPAHCAVTPEPCALRPLPDSCVVMAGARPVRLPAGSGHRPGMAPVDGEPGQHRDPAQRDEVGSCRVRQRDRGSGLRGRRWTGNRRRIRVDRKPLRHPRGTGAGETVARWRNNELWNPLPARGNIKLSKIDQVPSSRYADPVIRANLGIRFLERYHTFIPTSYWASCGMTKWTDTRPEGKLETKSLATCGK